MDNVKLANGVAPSSRSFYARVSALGFGLVSLTGAVALVTSLAAGNTGQGLAFGLVFLVVGLLVAGALVRFGSWALVLAAVLALALFGMVAPFASFPLSHPESGMDFIPVVLLLAGSLLGLVGAIVALVQRRRRAVRTRATAGERVVLGALLAVVALATALSLVMTVAARSAVPVEAKAGATAVALKDYRFTPDVLQARAGDTVRLVLKNDDPTLHTFTLPQAGVDVSIPPGTEKVVEFTAPAPGVYQWYCIPHSSAEGSAHTGMVGTLEVK